PGLYPLSLHDALPICLEIPVGAGDGPLRAAFSRAPPRMAALDATRARRGDRGDGVPVAALESHGDRLARALRRLCLGVAGHRGRDRKSTRLNSSHDQI